MNLTHSPLAIYEEHLRRGVLAFQFSLAAKKAVFFPRLICPFTGSDQLEWRISTGRGIVYATTVVHPSSGSPYNVSLIQCEEGFRLMSRVEDIDPSDVRIGMAVSVRIRPQEGDQAPYPVFFPTDPK